MKLVALARAAYHGNDDRARTEFLTEGVKTPETPRHRGHCAHVKFLPSSKSQCFAEAELAVAHSTFRIQTRFNFEFNSEFKSVPAWASSGMRRGGRRRRR